MIFFLFLKKGFWGYKMKETHITIYIHDLEISDKSKSFLARVDLMKLDDLLNCNMTELSAMRNISEDVLQELNGVIAHSDVIISFFEERAKRIKEILPNVQDKNAKSWFSSIFSFCFPFKSDSPFSNFSYILSMFPYF